MRWLIHFLAQLYPRSWRQRYGAEYAALLEQMSRTDLADVITRENLYERERTRRPFDDLIDDMRLDPTPRRPVYRHEAGRGLIIAGISSFLSMLGALGFRQRRRLRMV